MNGRRSSKLISRRMLGASWKSAAFGSGPPITPSAIQASMRSRSLRQGGQVRAYVGIGRPVHPGRSGHDRTARLDGQADRHAQPGPLRIARHRRAVALEGPPAESARLPLELVAPGLGLLDLGALLVVGGKQRRLRLDPVELAGDLPRALDSPAVELQCRNGHSREALHPHRRPWRSPASGRRACRGFPCGPASTSRARWMRPGDHVELRLPHAPHLIAAWIIRPMLLAVDVGNTQTHVGAFRGRGAGARLAPRHRAGRDRRRARAPDVRPARAGGTRASARSTARSSPRSCRSSAPSTSG